MLRCSGSESLAHGFVYVAFVSSHLQFRCRGFDVARDGVAGEADFVGLDEGIGGLGRRASWVGYGRCFDCI